jgi:hypothetical protein
MIFAGFFSNDIDTNIFQIIFDIDFCFGNMQRLIIHTRTSEVGLATLFNIREVINQRLSLRPVTTIHINHS